MADLPLFTPPLDAPAERREFIDRLRRLVRDRYRGAVITTDEVWKVIEAKKLSFPAGTTANVLGSFFASWEHAEPLFDETLDGKRIRKKRESRREHAHRNELGVWRIT